MARALVKTLTYPVPVANLTDVRANSNTNAYSYQAVATGATTHNISLARPAYPCKVLVTVTHQFLYGNSNGTALSVDLNITLSDGVTAIGTAYHGNNVVPINVSPIMTHAASFIVDYPAAANFSIVAQAITLSGSYSVVNSNLSVSASAIKIQG